MPDRQRVEASLLPHAHQQTLLTWSPGAGPPENGLSLGPEHTPGAEERPRRWVQRGQGELGLALDFWCRAPQSEG